MIVESDVIVVDQHCYFLECTKYMYDFNFNSLQLFFLVYMSHVT